MKTVMKKMFCLLLVAVMLVGVMPFQAFADGENTVYVNVNVNGTPFDSFSGTFSETPDRSSLEATANAKVSSTYPVFICNGWTESGGNAFDWASIGNGWTININYTTPYCGTCGTYDHNTGDNHCGSCGWGYGHSATCARNCDLGFNCTSEYHKSGCKYNTCETCGNTKHSGTCCSVCKQLGGNHAADCTSGCTEKVGCDSQWLFGHKGTCESQQTCAVCNDLGHSAKNCPDVVETCCGVQKGSAHRSDCVTKCTTERDCKNANHKNGCKYALCDTAGCTKDEGHTGEHTGVPCSDTNCNKALNHDGKHSYECPTVGCDKVVGHSGNCSNDPVEIPGNSDLHIFVNLYTADTLTKTTHLKSYEDISEDTLIYDFIADHRNELNNELAKDGYPGYEWSGHVYDEDNKGKAVGMNAKVGEGATVHINAYTAEDMVWIYVHNSRTMDPIRIIQLRGKQKGETITKKEVTSAVSKYYNISSLAMYTEQGWDDYVDGKKVDSVSSIYIPTDESYCIIDVKISGTAKSSSGGGYAADSTNPKTGDAIYVPVMVLGASASALAALFYLNKKRAF